MSAPPQAPRGSTGSRKASESRAWRDLFIPPSADVFWPLASLGLITGAGLAFVWIAARAQAAAPLGAALACLVAGGGVGFLFGIPKILQADRLPDEGDAERRRTLTYRQQVNTNLTEISDWLTKIIVGLGLINLTEIPHRLDAVARRIAASIATPGAADVAPTAVAIARWVPLATSVLVFFTVVGFLFGYLSTRLFLQSAFSRADQAASAPLDREVAQLATEVDALKVQQSMRTPGAEDAEGGEAAPAEAPFDAAAAPAEAAPEPEAEADGSTDALAELQAMADEYLRYDHPEWAARVRWKDDMAGRMAAFVRRRGIGRVALVRRAQETGHEGLVLAYATVVIDRPSPGDPPRLARLAPIATRLHVRYRVVLAFSRLLSAGMLDARQREALIALLATYEATADASLKQLIGRVRLLARAREAEES